MRFIWSIWIRFPFNSHGNLGQKFHSSNLVVGQWHTSPLQNKEKRKERKKEKRKKKGQLRPKGSQRHQNQNHVPQKKMHASKPGNSKVLLTLPYYITITYSVYFHYSNVLQYKHSFSDNSGSASEKCHYVYKYKSNLVASNAGEWLFYSKKFLFKQK